MPNKESERRKKIIHTNFCIQLTNQRRKKNIIPFEERKKKTKAKRITSRYYTFFFFLSSLIFFFGLNSVSVIAKRFCFCFIQFLPFSLHSISWLLLLIGIFNHFFFFFRFHCAVFGFKKIKNKTQGLNNLTYQDMCPLHQIRHFVSFIRRNQRKNQILTCILRAHRDGYQFILSIFCFFLVMISSESDLFGFFLLICFDWPHAFWLTIVFSFSTTSSLFF